MGREKTCNGSKKQLYYCNGCGTNFAEPGFKQKSYPGNVIITGLKLYAHGYSLQETSSKLNKRFKVNTTKNTVYNWVKEYKKTCKLLEDRKQHTKYFEPENLITENKYIYSGLEYPYKVHNRKLELAEKHGFERLAGFLKNIDEEIDHSIFEEGERSSQVDHKADFNFEKRENML